MMLTVGTDIIEIDRILAAIEKRGKTFLDRLFTEEEQRYCDDYRDQKRRAASYAGRFAAKEAVVKALGTGFGKEVSWHDITISRTVKGKPIATLSSTIQKQFPGIKLEISISHCRNYATAVAIASS